MLSIRFKKEDSDVIAFVEIDGERHVVYGRDEAEALFAAADLVYLIKNLCPSAGRMQEDRIHCYCRIGSATQPGIGKSCCRCDTWTREVDTVGERKTALGLGLGAPFPKGEQKL